MPETTPLIKAALNLRVGAGFDVYILSISSPIIIESVKRKSPINGLFTPFMRLSLLFELFFWFTFSCYFIVIVFQNRIILIRFCILLMWLQSCCTQIVPKHFPSSLEQQFIYIFFYFRF